MDTEKGAHNKLNKDQDALKIADTEGPEDLHADSSIIPWVLEDN